MIDFAHAFSQVNPKIYLNTTNTQIIRKRDLNQQLFTQIIAATATDGANTRANDFDRSDHNLPKNKNILLTPGNAGLVVRQYSVGVIE